MKQLFNSLSRTEDGAFIIDSDHRIIFWNQAAEELLEYTAGEVSGRQCYEILGGRDEHGHTLCQRFCRMAIRANSDDILPTKDVYTHTRSGEGRWLNVTTFAYSIGNSAIDRIIVHLFRDVTGNKEQQRFVDRVLAASKQLHQVNDHQVISKAPAKPLTYSLTSRERQVLDLLAQGLGTDEVAGKLVISPATYAITCKTS